MNKAAESTYSFAPHQLYWGIVDTTGLPPIPLARLRPGSVHRRILNLLDPVLPVPIEDVHTIFVPLSANRFLACAADRATLSKIRDAGHSAALPDRIPQAIKSELSTRDFNLLTGPFEPIAEKRARSRRATAATVSLVLVATFLYTGLIRREIRLRDSILELRFQQHTMYEAVLGPTTQNHHPYTVRLTTELRRLRATRDTSVEYARSDAALDLQEVLSGWPIDAELRVERLSVAPGRIDLTAEAADAMTAERLISHLGHLTPWRIIQNRVDRAGVEAVRIRLALEHRPPESGGSP